jgi:hypothetical protein
MITASGLEAAEACPASTCLPHSRSTGPDAEDGHLCHGYAYDLVSGVHYTEALAKIPERLHTRLGNLRARDLVGDLSEHVRGEIAYALNIVTDEVRELGQKLDRAYPDLGPEWMYGTCDIEGRRLDGKWVCKDLKSGMGEVTPAAANLQLMFFARVLWLLHDRDVVVEILRMRPDGTVFTESAATFKAFELDTFGARLLEIREGVVKVREAIEISGHPWTSEGSWCRYCAAFASCPAKNALARRLVPELEQLRDAVATLSPEDAGKAWLKLKQIGQLYDTVEAVLKERATIEPLPSRPDWWVRMIRVRREHFDQGAAVAMLRAKGATDVELKTLYHERDIEQVREVKRETGRKRKSA